LGEGDIVRSTVKSLRTNATDAERTLWQRLRAKQIRLRFRRQFPIGPYIVDFVCLRAKLIVEIDGGQHGDERDAARTDWLEKRGYKVLRFWNNDVLGNMDGVLRMIAEEIDQISPPPPASPS
jgi:very-short-patch-repair endonuclease